jgi:hypothetical protein
MRAIGLSRRPVAAACNIALVLLLASVLLDVATAMPPKRGRNRGNSRQPNARAGNNSTAPQSNAIVLTNTSEDEQGGQCYPPTADDDAAAPQGEQAAAAASSSRAVASAARTYANMQQEAVRMKLAAGPLVSNAAGGSRGVFGGRGSGRGPRGGGNVGRRGASVRVTQAEDELFLSQWPDDSSYTLTNTCAQDEGKEQKKKCKKPLTVWDIVLWLRFRCNVRSGDMRGFFAMIVNINDNGTYDVILLSGVELQTGEDVTEDTLPEDAIAKFVKAFQIKRLTKATWCQYKCEQARDGWPAIPDLRQRWSSANRVVDTGRALLASGDGAAGGAAGGGGAALGGADRSRTDDPTLLELLEQMEERMSYYTGSRSNPTAYEDYSNPTMIQRGDFLLYDSEFVVVVYVNEEDNQLTLMLADTEMQFEEDAKGNKLMKRTMCCDNVPFCDIQYPTRVQLQEFVRLLRDDDGYFADTQEYVDAYENHSDSDSVGSESTHPEGICDADDADAGDAGGGISEENIEQARALARQQSYDPNQRREMAQSDFELRDLVIYHDQLAVVVAVGTNAEGSVQYTIENVNGAPFAMAPNIDVVHMDLTTASIGDLNQLLQSSVQVDMDRYVVDYNARMQDARAARGNVGRAAGGDGAASRAAPGVNNQVSTMVRGLELRNQELELRNQSKSAQLAHVYNVLSSILTETKSIWRNCTELVSQIEDERVGHAATTRRMLNQVRTLRSRLTELEQERDILVADRDRLQRTKEQQANALAIQEKQMRERRETNSVENAALVEQIQVLEEEHSAEKAALVEQIRVLEQEQSALQLAITRLEQKLREHLKRKEPDGAAGAADDGSDSRAAKRRRVGGAEGDADRARRASDSDTEPEESDVHSSAASSSGAPDEPDLWRRRGDTPPYFGAGDEGAAGDHEMSEARESGMQQPGFMPGAFGSNGVFSVSLLPSANPSFGAVFSADAGEGAAAGDGDADEETRPRIAIFGP